MNIWMNVHNQFLNPIKSAQEEEYQEEFKYDRTNNLDSLLWFKSLLQAFLQN